MSPTKPDKEPDCGKKHLALLAGFAVMLVTLALTLLSMQSAMAEKLDARIRAVEQYRAEAVARDQATQATLLEIKADLKEIKAAVKPIARTGAGVKP